MRSLFAHREDVQHMLQQERTHLEASRMDKWVSKRLQQHVTHLSKELSAVDKRIMDHHRAHSSLKGIWRRLQTMRGIGPIGAASLLAEVGEIKRFVDPRELVSLAGLAVKRRDSGRTVHGRLMINRHGRMGLCRIFYMCAVSAIRCDAHMQRFATRLRA